MRRRVYDPGNSDIVAVVRDRATGAAISRLRAVGRFHATPYPGVIAGRLSVNGGAAEREPAPQALVRAVHEHPDAFSLVERAVPLEATRPFERDDVTEAMCIALEDDCARVFGKSFYVRARLRGLKGRVEGHAVERALGSYLWERAVEAGSPASVTFDDPDLVLVVQVLGATVGHAFLDRETRALDIVRPR